VRAALINIGRVLTANNTVETDPANTAILAMSRTLRRTRLGPRRVGYPSCRNAQWVNSRSTQQRDAAFAVLGVAMLRLKHFDRSGLQRASLRARTTGIRPVLADHEAVGGP
jgi:hypothetical protein